MSNKNSGPSGIFCSAEELTEILKIYNSRHDTLKLTKRVHDLSVKHRVPTWVGVLNGMNLETGEFIRGWPAMVDKSYYKWLNSVS